MNQESVLSAKNIKTIAIITILFVVFSLIFSLVQTPKYQSSVKLLTVFNENQIDPYTASKTSQYISDVLGQVIFSNSFVDNVFKTNYNLKDNLGTDPEKRQKNWEKMVKVKIEESRGIIDIDVLNTDRDQAYQYAQAITYTLITKHQIYHGFGDKVFIKIINNPVTSAGWAQPKILRNGLIGLVVGFIVGLTLVVIFPQQNLFRIFSSRVKKMATKDETIELVNHQPVNQEYQKPPEDEPLPPDENGQPAQADQPSDHQYYNW